VPLVASRFDSMTGATIGLAMRVDGVPRDEARYLRCCPRCSRRAGVIDDNGSRSRTSR
jgi:hypothetical protein